MIENVSISLDFLKEHSVTACQKYYFKMLCNCFWFLFNMTVFSCYFVYVTLIPMRVRVGVGVRLWVRDGIWGWCMTIVQRQVGRMKPAVEHQVSCKLFVCCSRALERKSRIISGPSNFSHIAHMGPDQGMQALIELPVVKILSLSYSCFDVQKI